VEPPVPFDNSTVLPNYGQVTFHVGDAIDVMRRLPARTFQCCVTSPPYYARRDYQHPDQIGIENTVDDYVENLVRVFREVRRVLRDDGTLWLNLGDAYANQNHKKLGRQANLKAKDLMMIPARVALALQGDGWWLRSDIIWHKSNLMPESISDRPTSAHEHIFFLSKKPKYFYDADAVREPMAAASAARYAYGFGGAKNTALKAGDNPTAVVGNREPTSGRNLRNVWNLPSQPFHGAHFATMPPKLAERCIRAGTKPGDAVLDPFGGAGTTGLVAAQIGRHCVLVDLNSSYIAMARERIAGALKRGRNRNGRTTNPSPVIDFNAENEDEKRLPVTENAAIHDLTSSEVKTRIRLRRAAAVFRAKTRECGNRLVTIWCHDSHTAKFKAEALHQSELIAAGYGGGQHDG
jgi:DNA modification methylase